MTASRKGAVVWFTGLSGAGKTTIAEAVRDRLTSIVPVELLDGDELREHLGKGLGFSREERAVNVRRIGYICRLLARHGVIVLAAVISPYADIRAELRASVERDGATFVEVHVNAELATVIARDVKGLYKRALAGELQHMTGVNDPYEAPRAPDLELVTDATPVDACVERVIAELAARGLLDGAAGSG